MLIMRKGTVMSSGEGITAAVPYAAAHKTKVQSVEICSTLGGYHELVVRWKDGAIGIFWTHDRSVLRSFLSEQPKWPAASEYSVQAWPVLLDPAPAPALRDIPKEPEEPEDPEEPEEPVRVRRTHSRAAPAPAPAIDPPTPPAAPAGRVRRAPRAGRMVDGDVTFI
jgi:hypothetical protein